MKRYCFALDLIDDPELILEYEVHHRSVWPEILESIADSGITHMEIYRVANRLFMIMDTEDTFSLEKKSEADRNNPVVQKWETLMWKYQQAPVFARAGEKWVEMKRVFAFESRK